MNILADIVDRSGYCSVHKSYHCECHRPTIAIDKLTAIRKALEECDRAGNDGAIAYSMVTSRFVEIIRGILG